MEIDEDDLLYHGTHKRFDVFHPRPAWFVRYRDLVDKWCGWKTENRTSFGVELRCRPVKPVRLIDLSEWGKWSEAGRELIGDEDPVTYELADAFRRAGLDGWFGRNEIMLSFPEQVVKVEGFEIIPK